MSLASNIVKRSGSSMYYARVEVPVEVQPLLRKTQLWKSLGTRDPNEAREKVLPVLMRWRAEFAELLKRREPTPADLQAAVWSQYEAGLERDRVTRTNLPTASNVEAAKQKLRAATERGDDSFDAWDFLAVRDMAKTDREGRAILLAEYRKHLATGETALISAYADQLIERDGLLIERGSPAYRDLCHRLQRAQIEMLKRTTERDGGDWAGVPSDPIVTPPDLTMGNRFALPGESIMELYDRFKAEKIGSARPDTWDQNRKIVKLFAEFIGETSHVTAITKKAVRDWKHMLARWPLKAGDMKAFEGMSFRKVIDANVALGKPTISQKTINKYLSAVGSFAEWLLQNEYIDADVMRGMYLSLDKRTKMRFPFTEDQLKTIFASPLFATCMGEGQEHKPGNIAIRDWRYWIPWVGLYSGARLGEIAQLLTTDVRQLHGTWIFHITEEGSTLKSTKTGGSMRVVPVHSELIKLGLVEYHAKIAANGEAQLFPQLKPDTRGFFSGEPSAFFNDYFRQIGVKVDKRVNFHSFRHGIADAFRSAGYMDEQFNMLLGHTKKTTTGKYGVMPQGILSERVKMIEAVAFSSLGH
jgi:integrase